MIDLNSIIENLKDIHDYVGTSYLSTFAGKLNLATLIALSTLLVILVLFITVTVIKSRRRIPAWQIATLSLDKLSNEFHNSNISNRQLYFDLTGIVRFILKEKFKIQVLGKTDTEVIEEMKLSTLDEELIKAITEIFSRGQSSKFASLDQVSEKVTEDLSTVKQILKSWSANTNVAKN